MPDPDVPWRDASVTAGCQHCGGVLPAGRPRRFCSNRCRQAAHRRRGWATRPAPPTPPSRSRTDIGVYECPSCGERLAGQRQCPDCHLFTRRVGDGGSCASCGEILTVDELLNPA